MITRLCSRVPQGIKPMPLAAYLDRAWPLLGKTRVSALLKKRQAKVNAGRADADAVVGEGDEVCLYLEGEYDTNLTVKYDDGFAVAFIKPEGLPVDVDAQGIGEDTVLRRLRLMYSTARLVHRLDTGTSGIMLAALTDEAEEYLTRLFSEHLLEKTYLTRVVGHVPWKTVTLKGYLVKDAKNAHVKVSKEKLPGGLYIETRCQALVRQETMGVRVTTLKVEIPTGRTHQIRAHLASIGYPVVGDDKYGDRFANKKLKEFSPRLSCRSIRVTDVPEAGRYAGYRFQIDGDDQ